VWVVVVEDHHITRTGGTSMRHLHNAQPVIIDDVSTLERNNIIMPN
jgi:hypothetical protein